jgi:hypothetical protein
MPEAHAHCPTFTGENYLFELKDAEGNALYTALLSVTGFTPNAETWKKAMAGQAGKDVTVTLKRARFTRGEVVEGPFVRAAPYRFTVAK